VTSALPDRALILAPRGRDAQVAAGMLRETGVGTLICADIAALVAAAADGAAFAVVTEEALRTADLRPFATWLAQQPEWSDFPFILLTERGGLERNPAAGRFLETLGNVTFLERPFHPTTLVSIARAALRARHRQYDARASMMALRELSASLEERVEAATDERQAVLAQLHEAQKLETIGQLTGGVAHDFNNLLTPITAALDLMQRRYGGSDPRAGRLIGSALQSAERAKTLVQRLLGFARRQTLQTRPTDLASLITGMRDLVASSVGPMIEVRVRCEVGLPPALVDPNQLELAILNLCVNSRDAMPDGGQVRIAAERMTVDADDRLPVAPGQYLLLSVTDTGSGMDAETLARAVEPFYSTKEQGKGTGLGLSMVHGLAAQMGGGFRLESAPGEGTRADLWLPAAIDAADRRDPAAPALPMADLRPMALLLVDDEELVRNGTAEMLRDLGHSVVEAASGGEALIRLADGLPIDALVTDYKMPGMSGAELAQRLHRLRPDVPVLLITGYTGNPGEAADLARLDKPFRQADLANALARLLEPPGDAGRRGN
jgi:signal transduction histidine kinase